jgi:hypothetical protein
MADASECVQELHAELIKLSGLQTEALNSGVHIKMSGRNWEQYDGRAARIEEIINLLRR